MPKPLQECIDYCPRKDDPGSFLLAATCKGLRVGLDMDEVATNEDGSFAGEVAPMVCGSKNAPPYEGGSIGIQDWTDTPLPVSALRRLHQLGLLPDQAL